MNPTDPVHRAPAEEPAPEPTIVTPPETNAPMPPIAQDPHAGRNRVFRWLGWAGGLVLIGGLVIMLNLFIAQPFQVDGESMSPTLTTGQWLYVAKAPKTWARLSDDKYIPKRGRVVIVVSQGSGGAEHFVKRVVGIPGDRVKVSDGKITIYNKANPEGFNPDNTDCCRQLAATAGTTDLIVPEGRVFVVGDNREAGGSIDSRSSLGTIPSEEIVGQVLFRFQPFRTL